MAESISSHVAWTLADAVQNLIPDNGDTHTDSIATVTNVETDGTVWVCLPGSIDKTPVNGTILSSVSVGDVVQIKIEGGKLSVVGNSSAPSVGAVLVEERVKPVEEKADSALAEAERAHQAADAAEHDAQRAHQAADAAEADAAEAAASATRAESSASSAATSSAAAQASASSAAQSASAASASAATAQQQAAAATTAATEAKQQSARAERAANSAVEDASAARESATQANVYSNAALGQLGVVQDVAGILSWASEHGTFAPTTDTAIQEGKVYFTYDGADYTPVVEPQADRLASYYELSVDEPMNDFIMAHLAVTSRGLWVLPSGMGQAQSEQQAPGYKMLLAADGSYLYDAQGVLVRSDTAAGTDFAATRDWHVGSDDGFIFYDASEGTITLGGTVLIGSEKTLSELVAESEQAAADAKAAVKTAGDVPIVTLSSTNGTTFKRNLGVSTTIVATIFTPAGRISTASELKARFGAGAYLEWGWRDVVTDADHVLVSSDPRIIMDGFGLVVSPGDVDSQAVITCSLNY